MCKAMILKNWETWIKKHGCSSESLDEFADLNTITYKEYLEILRIVRENNEQLIKREL